jgi:hypothetical protein
MNVSQERETGLIPTLSKLPRENGLRILKMVHVSKEIETGLLLKMSKLPRETGL